MNKPFEYPWDRVKPFKLYHAVMLFCRAAAPVLYRFRVVGRENLPESASGVILACNHLNAADPAFLMAATRLRWRFMAKAELFEKKPAALLYTHTNAFPVNRGTVDVRALKFALAALREGSYGLGIFPEGTRSPDGLPHEPKAGVAMFARRARADILPCAVCCEGKLKFRGRLTVRIGKVIPFEELGLGDSPKRRESRDAAEKIMAAITELWKQGHD
jgi:1-acyl-sn-glycerol-3-phosphate acyltransferase